MAKCKECLHMELCARDERLPDFTPEQEALCQFFVDRHRYVVREKGEWEDCDWVTYDGHGECIHYPKAALCCSRCRNAFKKELLWKRDFCPNCGADMRRRENDG